MKKLLFLATILLSAVSTWAKDGDQVTLQAGTASRIWFPSSAYFETRYYEATVEGKTWDQWLQSKGDDYVRDWPSDNQKVDKFFMERFNKKTKKKGGLFLQNTNPNDDFKVVIHFSEIDMGSVGGGVAAAVFLGGFARKAGGVNFKYGYLDIIDNATGKVVCRLSFRDVRGDSGMNMTAQLMLALDDLNDEIIGFADRFKDQELPIIDADQADAPQQATTQQTQQQEAQQQGTQQATTAPTPAPQQSTPATTPAQQQASAKPATNQGTATQQGQQVKVKMKSGATISGILKSFDPLKEIVIIVAGHETTIPMDKVENVEMSQDQKPNTPAQPTPQPAPTQQQANAPLGNRKLLVTESPYVPGRITITVGQTPIEMILVNGGRMNMGYDGDGSRKMHSEPVHEVAVTSFYISAMPLPASFVTDIVGTKNVDGKGSEPAQVRSFDDVETVISKVIQLTGRPLRLPTEAEWEYAASGDMQNTIFRIAAGRETAYEWCSDFLDWYPESGAVVTDPTGPLRGEQHVIRAYNGKRGKYDRSSDIDEDDAYLGLIRLVIKVRDYK